MKKESQKGWGMDDKYHIVLDKTPNPNCFWCRNEEEACNECIKVCGYTADEMKKLTEKKKYEK